MPHRIPLSPSKAKACAAIQPRTFSPLSAELIPFASPFIPCPPFVEMCRIACRCLKIKQNHAPPFSCARSVRFLMRLFNLPRRLKPYPPVVGCASPNKAKARAAIQPRTFSPLSAELIPFASPFIPCPPFVEKCRIACRRRPVKQKHAPPFSCARPVRFLSRLFNLPRR